MTNSRILQLLVNKRLSVNELKDLGFTDKQYIKLDSRSENHLIGKISYHEITEYADHTLQVENTGNLIVKQNKLSEKLAKLYNRLRDEKLKLKGLKNQIQAYNIEFDDPETAKELEIKIPKQEAIIKSIEIKIKLSNFK